MHKICWQKVSFKIKFLKMFIHQSGDDELNSRGIHSKSSSFEPSWPVYVQRPGNWNHQGHMDVPEGTSMWPWWAFLEPCGCHNSTTSGQIHAKPSSLGPSWPVNVQCHGYLPMGVIRASTGHWKSRPSSLEVSWPLDVHRYGHLPIGTTCACPWA